MENEGYARVRQDQVSDRDALAAMRGSLWPDVSQEEHRRELDAILVGESPGALPLVILVALDARGALSGFLEVGARCKTRTRRDSAHAFFFPRTK